MLYLILFINALCSVSSVLRLLPGFHKREVSLINLRLVSLRLKSLSLEDSDFHTNGHISFVNDLCRSVLDVQAHRVRILEYLLAKKYGLPQPDH